TLFAALVARHFEPEEVVVANGDAAVGQAFAALPFDHLLFTGSTAVGHHVMRAAAANLTPVTLELGGKSPAIVGPGARLEHAAERIMFGKLVNAGQTCIAPDYVLLPRARMGEFIDAARAATARLYPDLARNPQYASTATDRHYARLSVLRDEAHAAGATVEALSDAAPDPTRRLLPPVLLTNVHDDMAVMREEIFGPLLPVVPNDTLYHIAQHGLPFGGVGASGMGGYHGEAGFRTFSHLKPVFRQARWNGAGLLNPPYGARFRRMLDVLLKRG